MRAPGRASPTRGNASSSGSRGIPPRAPGRVVESAAAATARRPPLGKVESIGQPAASAPLNVSPAPVVSTTSTAESGRRRPRPSHARSAPPPRPASRRPRDHERRRSAGRPAEPAARLRMPDAPGGGLGIPGSARATGARKPAPSRSASGCRPARACGVQAIGRRRVQDRDRAGPGRRPGRPAHRPAGSRGRPARRRPVPVSAPPGPRHVRRVHLAVRPGATVIRFSPRGSTTIRATPVGRRPPGRDFNPLDTSASAPGCPSRPCRPPRRTRPAPQARRGRGLVAALASVVAGEVAPVTVWPGAGRRGAATTRSTLTEPTTSTRPLATGSIVADRASRPWAVAAAAVVAYIRGSPAGLRRVPVRAVRPPGRRAFGRPGRRASVRRRALAGRPASGRCRIEVGEVLQWVGCSADSSASSCSSSSPRRCSGWGRPWSPPSRGDGSCPRTTRRPNEPTIAAVFAGERFASRAPALRGGRIITWFAGHDVDLREATLDPAGAVHAAPDDVRRHPDRRAATAGGSGRSVLSIIGGTARRDPGRAELPDDAPVLELRGFTIFGGARVTTDPAASWSGADHEGEALPPFAVDLTALSEGLRARRARPRAIHGRRVAPA